MDEYRVLHRFRIHGDDSSKTTRTLSFAPARSPFAWARSPTTSTTATWFRSGRVDEVLQAAAASQLADDRAHHKPVAHPEWGLYENGDTPTYMRGMLAWMAGQHPPYQTISDYCPHGVWRCRANPKSSAVYRELIAAPDPR